MDALNQILEIRADLDRRGERPSDYAVIVHPKDWNKLMEVRRDGISMNFVNSTLFGMKIRVSKSAPEGKVLFMRRVSFFQQELTEPISPYIAQDKSDDFVGSIRVTGSGMFVCTKSGSPGEWKEINPGPDEWIKVPPDDPAKEPAPDLADAFSKVGRRKIQIP